MLIATWSLVMPFAQGPLSTVHSSTTVPTTRPAMGVRVRGVGDGGRAADQAPLPGGREGERTAPADWYLVIGVHRSWSVPAFATGLALVLDQDGDLDPKWVPHRSRCSRSRKTFAPTVSPVTRVLGSTRVHDGKPVPLTRVQVPVPGKVTGLPARVTVFREGRHAISCPGPASAAGTEPSNTVIVTRSLVGAPQGPFVHGPGEYVHPGRRAR